MKRASDCLSDGFKNRAGLRRADRGWSRHGHTANVEDSKTRRIPSPVSEGQLSPAAAGAAFSLILSTPDLSMSPCHDVHVLQEPKAALRDAVAAMDLGDRRAAEVELADADLSISQWHPASDLHSLTLAQEGQG